MQEIAGDFEAILEPIITADSLNAKSDSINYNLKPFTRANQAILRCWSDGVYLSEIFTRFYKLHLQIIARTRHWIDDVLNLLGNSMTNTWCTLKLNRMNLLVSLHSDIIRFKDSMEQYREQLVIRNIPTNLNETQSSEIKRAISKSFGDFTESLNQRLTTIQRILVDQLIIECGPEHLRQVNDLPRLYRKTNREIPTRCSIYVDQILNPLKDFHRNELISKELSGDIIQSIIRRVLMKIFEELVYQFPDLLIDLFTGL